MQSLKLRNFKGLFTNIDESDADHEYMRVCQDVKIRPGQMSSQNYKFEEIVGLVDDGEEVLHFETVYIDNDKNANEEVEGKLVSAYKRNLKPYYLLIVYKNETFVKLFDIDTKQLLFTSSSKNYPKFNKIKIVNNEGTVKIIANDTIYLLSKINRIRYPNTTIRNEEFLFEELIPSDFNLAGVVDSKVVPSGILHSKKVKTRSLQEYSDDPTTEIKEIFGEVWKFMLEEDNVPINMSVFPAASGVEEDTLRPIIQHISSTAHLGEWIFPVSCDTTLGGRYAMIAPQRFFEDYFTSGVFVPNASYKVINNPRIWTDKVGSGRTGILGGTYYVFDRNILVQANNLTYNGNQNVTSVGFENKYPKAFIIGTGIFDYQDEVVCYYKELDIPDNLSKYGIMINIDTNIINLLLPKRITALAFYVRIIKNGDFEQVHYLDLCSDTKPDFELYVNSLSSNGIYLNQTIGVMYDTSRYKLIRSVQDYKVISGIPFIISSGNLVAGAIGSGNAMNIFYEQNTVPDISNLNLTQIVDVNGTLGAADESSLNLINVTNTDGVLLFSKKDSLSYGISNANHIAELPEGIVIYTKQGIFVTNGYDKKLISEQINNIIEDNYDAGYIMYDSYNEELYFSDSRRLFKYSSQYNYWIQIGVTPNGILRVDDNGKLIFFSKDSREDKEVRYKCYRMVEGAGKGIVRTMKMDLGDPTILKSLRNIVFDFEGTIWVEGRKLESADRSMIVKSLHVGNPNSVRFVVEWQFTGTIYGVTLNYDLQGEARLRTYSNI